MLQAAPAVAAHQAGAHMTPLHAAAEDGSVAAIQALLQAAPAAAVVMDTYFGMLPLYMALTAGHAEAARCLLAVGDEPEPLLEALHRSGREEQLPLYADVAARLPLTPAVGAGALPRPGPRPAGGAGAL